MNEDIDKAITAILGTITPLDRIETHRMLLELRTLRERTRKDESRLKFLGGWGHPDYFGPTVEAVAPEYPSLLRLIHAQPDVSDPAGSHVLTAVREWIDAAMAKVQPLPAPPEAK